MQTQHGTEELVQGDPKKSAGFWARFTAGLIDLAGIAAIVVVMAEVLAVFGMYIPIELSVIIAYAAYTAVSIAWKGQTLGGVMPDGGETSTTHTYRVKYWDTGNQAPDPTGTGAPQVYVAIWSQSTGR